MRWEIAAAVTVLSSLGSIWLTRFVLLRLPADYLLAADPRVSEGRLTWAARNAAGLVLVLLGLVMAVPGVPGQGILTIVVGVLVSDLPGKRELERRLLGRPRVLALINRLRRRAAVPPLLPHDPPS